MQFSPEQFAQLLEQINQRIAPAKQTPAVTVDHTSDRFKPRDIGFFDPIDEAEPVESLDGKTIYHNVFAFTNRLRVKASTDQNASSLIAKNLDQTLLGKAQRWFTEEISDTTRAGLQTNIELWCKELENRFREAPGIALAKLERLTYTVADVRARKDPEDYIQQVIINGRNAGTATTEAAQVMMAYNHMDVHLRTMLRGRPSDTSNISDFLHQCQEVKHDWFDMYKPYSQPRTTYPGKQRGYKSFYNSSTTSESATPSFQARLRSKPGNFNSNSNSNSHSQSQFQKSFTRSNNQVKQEPTAAESSGYRERTYTKVQQRDSKPPPPKTYDRSRNFRNKGRANKAYHVGKDTSDQENEDPEAELAYDPEFYHGTHYQDGEDDNDEDDKSQASSDASQVEAGFSRVLQEDIRDVGFVMPKHVPRPRKCDRCHSTFPSGNAFHRHLPTCKRSRKPSSDEKPSSKNSFTDESISTRNSFTDETLSAKNPFTDEAISANKSTSFSKENEIATSFTAPETVTEAEKPFTAHSDKTTAAGSTITTATAPSSATNKWPSAATAGSSNTTETPIVPSHAPRGQNQPGYGYRGFQYATLSASIGSPVNTKSTLCADSGCVMSLIDRQFLKTHCPTTQIHTMATSMKVKGVGDKLHDANQYADIDVYIPATNGCVAHFKREFHIVDGLDAHALIGADILYPESWVLDFSSEEAILTSNMGIKIKLRVVARGDQILRTVFSKKVIVIPPKHRKLIPITGAKGPLNLPKRDFTFEPASINCDLFTALINNETTHILAENDTNSPIVIRKHTKLGQIHEAQTHSLHIIPTESEYIQPLASKSSKPSWKRTMMKGLLAATAAAAAYSATTPRR